MAFVRDDLDADGWLVNQTRMWVASQWSVRAGHDWHAGEDELFRRLLDGSRAANRLGWQWTVGTGSGKAYGFSRWQVEKRAPQLCAGCPLRDRCPVQEWPDAQIGARVPPPAGLVVARSTSVRDWAWRWFDQHSASLRTSTVDSYKGLLETCVLDRTVLDNKVGRGDLVLQSLTPMRVGEWLAQLQRDGLSASRVRQAYRVLSLRTVACGSARPARCAVNTSTSSAAG